MPSEWATRRAPSTASGEQQLCLAIGPLVGPELEGDGDDVAPGLALAQRRDGGVDAAAEGDEHALAVGGRIGEAGPRTGQCGEGPMEGVRGEHRGVAMGGREPAELGLDLIRARLRAASRTDAPSASSATAAAAAALAAQPSRSKVTRSIRPSPATQRDADQVAAGGAAGGAAEGTVGTPARGASRRTGTARRGLACSRG